MATYRLKNENNIFFKDFDASKETIEFTSKKADAKTYPNGEWWAQTELDFLKFHFGNDNKELESMCVVYC